MTTRKHKLRYPRMIGVATEYVSKNYLDCWTLDSVDNSLRRIRAIVNSANSRRRLTLQNIRDFWKKKKRKHAPLFESNSSDQKLTIRLLLALFVSDNTLSFYDQM